MPRKGHKSRAGVGDSYGEVKKDINLTLTPTAIDALGEKAKELKISKSELVERLAKGKLSRSDQEETNQSFVMIWWEIT